MALDQLISKLLYVPFNEDYKVIQEIKDKLTEKIFFDECFVLPAFDEEIQNALNGTGDEVDDFEMDLDKKDIINKLQKRQEKFDSLKAWVESGQSDIYCIRGDAGTGKSTFLHYLKNQYINDNIIFEIVDIQKATVVISVLGKSITIPKFSSLYFKAISAILHNIFDTLYIRENNGKVKYKETYQNAIRINSLYNNNFKDYYPREETTDFFSMLTKNIVSSEDYRYNCEMIADNIESWTEQILNNNSLDEQTKFSIVLEILIYYLNCNKNAPRHIIAFDNFERFIGTDEIYDDQLTEFVSYLRTVQKAIASNNIPIKGTYQIIIFMRNTSVRMFTSQQITEFFSHDIDLSDWFDVGSVVKKKIEWYLKNDIAINEVKNLLNIFNDMGECGETLRGLHFKISMLFNYNKRIVIEFIARVLLCQSNKQYIELYKSYWNNNNNVKPSLNKFAARSIIYRLTLNELRDDGFFVNIIAQCPPKSADAEARFNGLECSRKILTILYLHDLECTYNADSRYLPFERLIEKLFPKSDDSLQLLLDDANQEKLDIIAQVLFYMNYYNARKENWLQFVDLQYNSYYDETITISDPSQLKEYIKLNPKKTKIRITNAGKAYLYFVVYYFEFFSCKSINTISQKQLFQNKDMPPLLCTIPTVSEIEKGNIDSLTSIKIINVVLNESLSNISTMNNSENPISFKRFLDSKPIVHQQRIVNSHRGFLDNYIEFFRQYYDNEYRTGSTEFKANFDKIINKIIELRNQYDSSYRKE